MTPLTSDAVSPVNQFSVDDESAAATRAENHGEYGMRVDSPIVKSVFSILTIGDVYRRAGPRVRVARYRRISDRMGAEG